MPSNRRKFIQQTALAGASLALAPIQKTYWGIFRSPSMRPEMPLGISSGDILADRAVIWSRSSRPSRMWIDWSATESFSTFKTVEGPAALPESDFTAKIDLSGLPQGQQIFYRVRFQSLEDLKLWSEPVTGTFRTVPKTARNIRFLWSGDTCGQGYGINPEIGGMKIYETMRLRNPDFFIHSGDAIYADNPIPSEIKLPDGRLWRNLVTEEKSKVAESLAEFRGNYAYNLLDENLRGFNAGVPILYQWDDHEVLNNWYPQEILTDPRYKEKSVALLAARGKRAFLEYTPIRTILRDPERIFRQVPYGPLLDVFMLDLRSYRSPNGPNRQTAPGEETDLLGKTQMEWLKSALKASKATWKVIASDMPIGLIVYDDYINKNTFENGANGSGQPLGRELEMANLLRFILQNQIKNVVWLTADVHYTAALKYDPATAQFKEFRPFYEFVSGPLNAGTFGPNELDNTFGPKVLFQKTPPPGQANLSPLSGMQFFGEVNINAATKVLTVDLKDMTGESLYSVPLKAEG